MSDDPAAGMTDPVQRDDAPPVIENDALPPMPRDGTTVSIAAIGDPTPHLMPAKHLMSDDAGPSSVAGARMDPLPSGESLAEAAKTTVAGTGDDQEPLPDSRGARAPRESYLRIRVTVTGGDVQVTHLAEVDGPLGPPAPLHGGLAYEVTVRGRALRVGAIPDPGIRRSFAGAAAPPEQQKHFFVTVPSYDFTARVPRNAISAATLPHMHIAVLRLDPSQAVHPTGDTPLVKQFPHLAQEITRLPGIDVEQLAAPVRTAVTDLLD